MCSAALLAHDAAVRGDRPRSLRVRRGEQERHRPAFGQPEQRSTLGSRLIHDRPDVVHPLLERRRRAHAVGHSDATLVEDDQA
jgi:hypothetical protein